MGHDGDRIIEWASVFTDPIKMVSTLSTNVITNLMAIISDVGVLINAFDRKQYETAGKTYADILVLVVGNLPPPLEHSGMEIKKDLSNLHELIPHKSNYCFDADGAKIPGRCGEPNAVPANLYLY